LKFSLLISVLTIFCVGSTSAADNFSGAVKQPLAQTLSIQQQSQQHADDWEQQRVKLVAELERLQLQQQQLGAAKEKLNQKISGCNTAITELQRAIAQSQLLTAQMEPFLQETVRFLTQQVENDLPFLAAERHLRLQQLNASLVDDSLALGEKFRRLMEVVRVEVEYGRNVEVTQGTIVAVGSEVLMNQLRLGRLALFAQSLDGQRSMIYNMSAQAWLPIDSDYNRGIAQALEMGLKRRPVDLLTLPIGKVVVR